MIKVQLIQQGALVTIAFQTENSAGVIKSTLEQVVNFGQDKIPAFIVEELKKLELT